MGLQSKPPGFNEGTFFKGIHWHQKWEMFEGVFTPGRNPASELLDYALVPSDLTGKTVLDVGAWNGGFSFECARRGATRVVGFGPDDPDTSRFNKIRQILDFETVGYSRGSIYDVSSLGTYDIVLFFGVLYHLRYPLSALDNLYQVCRDQLYVESFAIDQHFLLGEQRKAGPLASVDPDLCQTAMWQFYQFDELNRDGSNWFGPNCCGLRAAIESAGFIVDHEHSWGHRVAFGAKKGERQFASLNAYEKDSLVAASVKLRV